MEQLDELMKWLQTITLSIFALRAVYCCIKLTHEDEEAARYKKRLRNTIIISIIVVLIFQIADIINSYYI